MASDSEDYGFVQETPNTQRKVVFFTSLLIVLLVVSATLTLYFVFKENIDNSSFILAFKHFISNQVAGASLLGMFYTSFIGGFFFLFTPVEFFFFLSMKNGNPPFLVLLATLAGLIPAYLINYFIGSKLGVYLLTIISKKKVYGARRKINKYGVYAILLFSILPLPADILTLALGMTKYNIFRLFGFIILGSLIKYSFLILLFKGIF